MVIFTYVHCNGFCEVSFRLKQSLMVSFGIPVFLAFRKLHKEKSDVSLSMESSSTAPVTEKSASDEPPTRVTFKGFAKARDWISDPIGMKFIEKYIIHYQVLFTKINRS